MQFLSLSLHNDVMATLKHSVKLFSLILIHFYFCFLRPPSLIPSLLEHHTARLLPNGCLVTRGSYNLPSGDQNFKQGARTGSVRVPCVKVYCLVTLVSVQAMECQASRLEWCLGWGQGLFSALCSGELLIFIPQNNYSRNPLI